MQITEIKIAGFKSFVDPVTFYVEPGLTGIVGPNGCGKSNLLESLRWIMGASSAKALRGGEMDDLIFAGTSKRPAREMAEVTLVLDNTDRRAPPDFNDSDRLEVTRRLRRGVGSTYKINGRTVRGKDIQLLFADASTGANSPALVRQGQISELIASKPQNRRRLLEEAAGIAGLNTRRHEAELKLRGAEANLERLSEVSGEVERQLGSLKRQASKARKYKALSGQIEALDALLCHMRWHAAKEAVLTAETAVGEGRKSIEELSVADALAERKALEARDALPPLRDAEADVSGRLGAAKVRLTAMEGERKAAVTAVDRHETDLQRIVADLSREQDMVEDAEKRLSEAQEALDRLPSLDADAFQRDQDEARGRLHMAQQAVAEKEREAQVQTESLAKMRAERDARQRELRAATQRHTALKSKLQTIEVDLARLPDVDRLQAERTEAETAREKLVSEIETAEAAIETAESELQEARQSREAATGPVREADADLRGLKAEIAALQRLVRKAEKSSAPPVLDALHPQPGFERALAAALGDDLNAPVDKSAPAHWAGGRFGGGSALPSGVTPLNEVCSGPSELETRLSQCGVVETVADAEAFVGQLQVGQRLVSKDGGLWRWDGFVRRADAPLSQAEQLEQRARLEALEAKLPEAETLLADARETAEKLEVRVKELETALKARRQTLPQLLNQRKATESKAFQAEQTLERVNLKRESLLDTRRQAQGECDEAAKALSTLEPASEQDDESGLKARLERSRAELADLRRQEGEAQEALRDLERNRDRLEGRKRGLAREIKDWTGRRDQAGRRLEELQKARTATREALEAAKTDPTRFDEEIEKLSLALKELEDERKAAADAHAAAETQLREAETEARRAKDAAAKARETTVMAQAQLDTASERLQDVVDLAKNQFSRQPEGLLILAQDTLDDEWLESTPKAIEGELITLRHDLQGLGAINQDAEREAEELAERLGSQETEKGDLTSAIAKLREGVQALNNEGRDRLLAAFETVNNHFQSLFTALFNGGQAELRLVDADDPLMAGLEIMAQPPGKRLTSLSLMSGGEQALTATALIFAVFLSNPAPICVLDEVDAPLDDVNVDRFCRLLDEMRQRTATRFVTITHNPVSMSRMDRLFGVTMQEQGVSRLVSVDLGTAEQLVAAE